MKESTAREKYNKMSVPQLRKLAQKEFNEWVRKRDMGQSCISCGANNPTDAGHFYSAGHHPGLALNEDNCFLQCKKCNLFLSGNLIGYLRGLIKRIGQERVDALEMKQLYFKRHGYKHDRFSLIESILTYRNKNRV